MSVQPLTHATSPMPHALHVHALTADAYTLAIRAQGLTTQDC